MLCFAVLLQGAGTADSADAALTKVVLARRSDVRFTGALDPITVLATLQERDPRAYQFFLQVTPHLISVPPQTWCRCHCTTKVSSPLVSGCSQATLETP